ncbi:MAG: helix-turn-helix domain-containing protein [Thermodesulfobacteriota bacterium]
MAEGLCQGPLRREVELPAKRSFRPDEVAALLGKSRRTVYRYIRRGLLAAYGSSRGARIARDDLDRFINKENDHA